MFVHDSDWTSTANIYRWASFNLERKKKKRKKERNASAWSLSRMHIPEINKNCSKSLLVLLKIVYVM